ncbi:cysteine-rich repeat secretory protein 55-like [Tasmannia lanceolata]|uniref:cysteine-rich repeat secretory protein 55-like n=1 Tax=Tasmannia lanceolata TaxID=3420 RepID=UPI004062A33C
MTLLHRLLFFLFSLTLCSADPIGQFCNNQKNLSSSQTSANVDRLLAELATTTALNSFSTASYGRGPNKVYGLAQCRGDVSPNDCSTCITGAVRQIRQRCPNQADARIWYDYCFLCYNTEDFFDQLDTGFGIFLYNVADVTDGEVFERELGALMDRIRPQALMPMNRALGKGETKVSPFVTIYGLVQCTRDLSQLSCAQCLAIAIAKFPSFCQYKEGCQVIYSSCNVRYEIYPFFFPLDPSKKVVAGTFYKSVVYP